MKRDTSVRTVPREHHDLLATLARRYSLSTDATLRLDLLLGLLTTDPRAPTAVREPGRALRDHLADSLVALGLAEVRSAGTIADLGSGAGLPGLPLAIALAPAEVALVESNGRKCEFISRAIDVCGVANATVIRSRAESWLDGREQFELVCARAVAPLPVVAEYAAPLLRLGGALLAWRGRRDLSEEAAATAAADELGLRIGPALPVQPYPGALHRHLQLMVKIDPTPRRFPRRPGMARKRPLG